MTIFPLYFSIFLSLSLPFLLPTIINLLRKNIHHLLSLATIFDMEKLHLNSHSISPHAGALGITTLTKDAERHDLNVPKSTTANPPPTTTIRFVADIGGEDNDGLISCTESLDERGAANGIGEANNIGDDCDCRRMRTAESRGRWRRDNCGKNEVKSFPPPLSSLNFNGQPSYFLRPVRKDGRLELTEVRIHRPEILQASRENGRLRLHLVPDENFLDDVEEEEEEEEEVIQEQEEDITETEKEEKKDVGEIKYKKELKLGMRCHEMVNHHHHVHGSHHHHMRICGVGIV